MTYLRVGDPSSFSIRWISAARPGLSRRIRAGRADPHSGKPAAASRRLAPAPKTTVSSSQAQQVSLRYGETARASGIAENRGFGPHSPSAAGDWRGGARSPPSGHSEPPGGGRTRRSAPRSLARSPQYATANMADVKTTQRCALQRRQPFPTHFHLHILEIETAKKDHTASVK